MNVTDGHKDAVSMNNIIQKLEKVENAGIVVVSEMVNIANVVFLITIFLQLKTKMDGFLANLAIATLQVRGHS